MNEREIFDIAVAIQDPRERAAYLDRACGQDATLLRRIEELLAAERRLGDFLESPPVAMSDAALLERPGTQIGPYTLLRQIGEGGFGVVFMAEQREPVRRDVALKIVKPGLDTRQVIARFDLERQALARMDHPNIARVLDAGTTESRRPFFVMELVIGTPITEYCDQHQLTVRQRLELLLPVCQAIQHAHQKGIIHRDIKPSNVLIARQDEQPTAKVIDFGVAKAIDQPLAEASILTGFGQILGTLEYMSPEQADAQQPDIDTRSDIYSLGVLMYQLLTGTTPLDRAHLQSAGWHELLRIIREEDPPVPSQRLSESRDTLPAVAALRQMEPGRLAKSVRGELDWIVMKALDKDRARRYVSVTELAADIQRYLSDDPVLAGPPNMAYRARKFIRRHTMVIVTLSLVATALLVGAAVSAWQAVKASHAALAAQTAQATAESRAAETEAVLKFFSSRVFEVARPQGMDGALGRDVTLRQAIEAALPHMQTDLQGQPLAEARLRSMLGFTLKALDDQAMAATQFLRAKELFTAQLGSDHPLTLDALDGLAGSYHLLGRYEEAITLREASLRLTKEKFGPDHPLTHASSTWLAQSYCLAGRLPEACRLLEETLRRQQASFGSDNSDTLESKSSLGSVYLEMGRIQDAAAMLEEVLAQEERSYPRHPRKLVTMGALARAYDELGRHDEACTLFEKAVQLQEQTLGRDHLQTLIGMGNLAVCYRELERYEDSLTLNQEILQRAETKLGREHAMTLGVAHNLACDYQELQRDDEAVRILEELLPRLQTVLGADHRQTLLCMQGLANSYLALERCAEALRILDDALVRAGQNAGQSELVPGLLQVRFRLFRKTKDASGFQDTLRQWEALPPRTADEMFATACVYAVGAELSAASDKAAASQAEQAIASLKRAIAAGWKDGVRLQEEPDLNLLRDRADFQTLLAELNAEQVLPPDPKKVQNPPTRGDKK